MGSNSFISLGNGGGDRRFRYTVQALIFLEKPQELMVESTSTLSLLAFDCQADCLSIGRSLNA